MVYRHFPHLSSPGIGKAEEAVYTALDQLNNGTGSDAAVNAASWRLEEAELKAWEKQQEQASRFNDGS